ncbi:hypothetical protein BGZ65_003072 [Modicella reniformis]|uniref:Zn(2)-C6 fungal-type domain-containing protein n=1 Tax=Modicella reniformis TaxID=1440133 RepID=A0A9P6M9F1_9FUNG|nr:hypothetical protein BGZ65_003072 [Modicella reniformis]
MDNSPAADSPYSKALWPKLAHDTSSTLSLSAPEESESTSKKVPTKQRIRITIACITCRHKKIKCDGQVPCSHCDKSKTECIYPAATKPVNHEYVETLENRLKSIEFQLHELLSMGMDDSKHASAGEMGEYLSRALQALAEQCEGSSSSATLPRPNFGSQAADSTSSMIPLTQKYKNAIYLAGSDATATEEAFRMDGSMAILSLLVGKLKVDRDGTAKFLLAFDTPKELSYTEARIYHPSPGSPGLSKVLNMVSLDWESVDLPCPYTLPASLMPSRILSELIDIYFKSVHAFLPLLHKPSFLTLCQDGEYRVPPFLLMAICAVASRQASASELESMARPGNPVNHHILFDHARALLDTYIDIPRISTIQGLLLLAYYQIKEKRTGHHLRVRMYLNTAIRMALDMGLNRDLYRSMDVIEASSAGDSPTSTVGYDQYSQRSEPSTTGLRNMSGNGDPPRKKLAVIQLERRLTWLACYFLDGLLNGQHGLEYSVTNMNLEMRRLIRDPSYTTDTVQGATLIFWYLHLDLVHLYRRICEMYRFQASRQSEGTAMTNVLRGTEMLSIEHSLENWITTVPAHLVYTLQGGSAAMTGSQSHAGYRSNLPSYYSLYLHRFYCSIKLLLYRPIMASKTHRGDISDPTSVISKCASAATQLTEIGEFTFQNYSWPWPGCGFFDYQMLQALEVHVYMMVIQTHAPSQSLYSRTIDLVKGYFDLMEMPDLVKDVVEMRQTVDSYFATSGDTALTQAHFSNLQQFRPHQHQVSEASYYSDLNNIHMHLGTPVIDQLTQQRLHVTSSVLSQAPVSNYGELVEGDAHTFPPPISTLVRSEDLFHGQATLDAFSMNHTVDMRDRQQNQELPHQLQQAPLLSFLTDMDIPSFTLYDQSGKQIFQPGQQYQHHHQQQQQQQQQQQYYQEQNFYLPMQSSQTPSPALTSALTPVVAPVAAIMEEARNKNGHGDISRSSTPKPPKRIHSQSTDDTGFPGNASQTQTPRALKKKPSRLLKDTESTIVLGLLEHHLYQQPERQEHGLPPSVTPSALLSSSSTPVSSSDSPSPVTFSTPQGDFEGMTANQDTTDSVTLWDCHLGETIE